MRKFIDEIIARYEDWRRMRQFKREFEELFMPDVIANREIAYIMSAIIAAIIIYVVLT